MPTQPGTGPKRTTPSEQMLALYRGASIGESQNTSRDHAARQIRDHVDEKRWKELSGNPRGILITPYLFEPTAKGGHMQIQGDRLAIFERPKLVLERMSKAGDVLESRPTEYVSKSPEPSWAKGWTQYDYGFSATFPTKGLTPGIWRAVLVGTAGGDKVPWRSEPNGFRWPPK